MTAATTTKANKKKGMFSLRFKSKFSEDMKLFITNLVFQLLCLPVVVGVFLREMYIENNKIVGDDSVLGLFIMIAAIALCLSIAMGIVIPMMNFRYLYNKSLVDMNYSLPLNNRQRFFADFFAGLATYMLPVCIGVIIAGAELLIGSCFIEIKELSELICTAIQLGSIVAAGMLILYTLSVFAITFAGSTFEAIFSIAAVNIMIPTFIYFTWMNIVNAAHFGLNGNSITRNYTFFTTSPIGVFGYIMYADDKGIFVGRGDSSSFTDTLVNSMYLNFMVRILLFMAVLVAVTFLLYKHRKAEDVSKPYVYKAFYYIIMSVGVYCVFSMINMMNISGGSIAAIIISGILWFVMEVIRRRGFKRFWTAVVSFAAASAAVMCIIKVIDLTDGLGRAKVIPSESSVTDVEIDIWGDSDALRENRTFHDKKLIKDVMKLNKELVDRHFDPDKYEYEMSGLNVSNYWEDVAAASTIGNSKDPMYRFDEITIRMTYYTRSGSSIIRQYTIPSEMLTELYCDMYTSEEYAKQVSGEIFRNSLRTDKKENDYDVKLEDAGYCIFNLRDKLGASTSRWFSVEEGRELTEALRKDMASMSVEELKNSEFYCELEGQTINSACVNTVKFFEDHNVKYKKTSEELAEEIDTYSNYLMITRNIEYVFPIVLIKGANYENYYDLYTDNDANYVKNYLGKYYKLDSILSLNTRRRSGSMGYNDKHIEIEDKKAIEALFDIAVPVITGEKVLAEIGYNDVALYIKDEPGNSEIIENAINAMKIYTNSGEYSSDYIEFR
ncbi:hypothetical protein SAMN02910265_02170 [Ruminococcus flavefaciens]|uniref:ABC-2 type transport system permease protein n=1 Tax=Ruminococcus flavefaciens TaxID=1265 RepID=A0A1H6KCX3_RUMFL|nr:hypothetical protein [Ruminococcus flavefaciens]SEH69342.1 hypothetical protein SAMN02910265_02170 [Ruminococcus flavefaciens]